MKSLAVLVALILFLGAAVPALGQGPGELRAESPPDLGASVEPAAEKQADAAAPGDGSELVSIIVTFDETLDGRDLERASGGQAIYRYRKIMNGAALVLAREAIPSVAGLTGVTAVYHDRVVTLDTGATPALTKAPDIWEAAGGQDQAGEGVVVGIIDSGIWPEHPSFSDPDPAGNVYSPPRITPGDNGFGGRVRRSTCDFGASDWNPDDAAFECNNKLIGAYRFQDTYDALRGLAAGEFASARDSDGSGTHTASVAAGNANLPGGEAPEGQAGAPVGPIAGVAPRAHLIAYRTAAGPDGGSYYSDIAAAIEQAMLDGVDVLAYSMGGGADPYGEAPSLALLAAYDQGIFIAAPAGNEGPSGDTVAHREPWVLTAAASRKSEGTATSSLGQWTEAPQVTVQLGGPLGLVARAALLTTAAAATDVVAGFSSRGGDGQTLGISKPDLSAPGVGVTGAGAPSGNSSEAGGARTLSGTAVSAAQLAGAGALLKYLHPGWTPGQIQSALMLSARTAGLFLADGVTRAGPFDSGSGGLDLARAARVSVTMAAEASQFADHGQDLWNTNYPSLYLPAMPGRIWVQRRVENTWHEDRKWILSVRQPEDVSIALPNRLRIQANDDELFEIKVDAREVPIGEVRHATIEFQEDDLVLHMPVTIVRQQPPVSLETDCSQALIPARVRTTCLITATNNSPLDAAIILTDPVPERLAVVPDSVAGASLEGGVLLYEGTLAGSVPSLRLAGEPPLYGYVPLADFGVAPAPCPDNCDDGGFVVSGLDFVYQDIRYDEAIWSVNGTLELGTSSGTAASGANTLLPDPAMPNNLLAPWWTDLDLSAGGEWYLGALADSARVYDVFEWREIPRYKDKESTATFQIWLARGTDLGWFTYGGFAGDVADGTTGVEDAVGAVGQSAYHGEGESGAAPRGDLLLDQNSGAPGQTHIIAFTAKGAKKGRWQNCVRMEGDLWDGEAIACFMGQVVE